MEYLDGIERFKQIEGKYDVMSIKFRGISVWPYLRIYLFDSMATHMATKHTTSALTIVLKSLFRYNPLRFFKTYRVWDYAASITRKKIGDKYEHHVSGFLHKSGYPVLTVEFTSPGSAPISNKEIPERNIVSSSWSILLSAMVELLLRPFPVKIERETLLKQIMEELQVQIDYKSRLRWLLANRVSKDIILAIGHKPELVVLECYYTGMGKIWSFHNHNIPVVELQHGVINKNHYAYNSEYRSDVLYPDELCVYGVEEYAYFTRKQIPFAKRISQTGVYILEQADKYFIRDIFDEYRAQYDKIAVVAGETGFEEQVASFIDEVANKLPSWLFIYIPRRSTDLKFCSPNVKFVFGVNIYEYLKWCDVHITRASTTGLEAHYFKKPVVFYDFDGVAKEYYKGVIDEKNGAFYLDSIDDFCALLPTLNDREFKYREIFAHESEKKMKEVLDRYLNK